MRTGGRSQIQLRFEIFNVFNRTNFLSQALVNTMNLQSVTLDAAGTKIVSFVPGGNFGQATRTRDPRQMQFGVKILF